MPQVPYSPVPNVAPSGQEIPSVNVPTPGAAFGENIAQAVQGLGRTTEQAGSELFGRAMALQQIHNEAGSRDQSIAVAEQLGLARADFLSKSAADAQAALPKYQQTIKDIRQKALDSAPNMVWRQMLDADVTSRISRDLDYAGFHAATELKKYSIGTAEAKQTINAKQIEDYPDDEGLVQQRMAEARSLASQTSAMRGFEEGSPEDQLEQLKATSQVLRSKVIGKNKRDPFVAAKWLEDNKKGMTQPDYNEVLGQVQARELAVGSANIANNVINKHLKPDGTLDDTTENVMNEIRDSAGKFDPQNALLPQRAVSEGRSLIMQRQFAATRDTHDAVNQYKSLVANPDGTIVKNEQELLAKPGMTELLPRLPPAVRNDIPGYIHRTIDSTNRVNNEEAMIRVNGMMSDPSQRAAALEYDPTNAQDKLSYPQVLRVQAMQAGLRKDVQGDPRVDHAVKMMQAAFGQQMDDAGIKKTDTDVWNHFRGGVQSAIDTFTEDHKHRPSDQEFLKDIAPILLQTHGAGYSAFHWFGGPQVPLSEQTVPEDFATKQRADADAKQGAIPSDAEIYKAYVRSEFIKLYDKRTKAK